MMSKKQRELEIAKECLLEEAKETDEFLEDLLASYDEAADRLKGDIQRILVKFAEDNELTVENAREYLASKEYSRWKKSIQEYLEQIDDEGKNSKMVLELNTLSAKSRISRKEQLLGEIDKQMSSLASLTNKEIKKHLVNVLVTNYYRGHYSIQKTLKLGFNVSAINHSLVKSIIEFPWSTKQFSKTIWDDIDKMTETLRKELASGFIDGSSIQKMVKRIDDALGKGKYVTQRLVRTEAKYFAQQAQLMSYKKLGIDEYYYKGAGCPKCAPLDGKKFKIEDAEVGVNCPPMHPNCKCRVIAVTTRSLFDMDSNTVPLDQNIKFKEWKEKFVKDNKA